MLGNIDERITLPNFRKVLEALGDEEMRGFNFSKVERLLNLRQLGRGSSRLVFAASSGNYVLKIPRSAHGAYNGIEAQLSEWLLYKRFPKLPLAKCELYFVGSVPVLLMEKVEPCSSSTPHRRLKGFCDGDTQIGLNSKGRKVCYDYGYEIMFAVETMKTEELDFTQEEVDSLLSHSPSLTNCPYVLMPQFSSLTV